MRTVLVCVKTPAAAQAIVAAAGRLGLAQAVRTAVTTVEALALLAEEPADLLLVDPASVRPDTAAFCRRVLGVAPGATIVFFGSEEPQAAAAVAAGARAVIRADVTDPMTPLTKVVLLILSQIGRSGDGPQARRALVPAQVPASRFDAAGQADPVPAAGGVARPPAWSAGRGLPQQRSQPIETGAAEESTLRVFWRLVEASSLGSDGARRLRDLVDPVRSAAVASRAGLGAGTPAVRYLLGEFVAACYSGDGPDHSPEGAGFTQVRTLARLLLRAGRRGEAAELWRLAAAAGEGRAANELAQIEAPPGRRSELTERELLVLAGMADGRSNAEIGHDLSISEDAVKTHARRLFRKLGARDRAHAVAAGFRAGLIT